MTNRKKRLKKGVKSLKKQISLHEEKLKKAKKEGKLELAGYYEKEIKNMNKYKIKKEKSLKKINKFYLLLICFNNFGISLTLLTI